VGSTWLQRLPWPRELRQLRQTGLKGKNLGQQEYHRCPICDDAAAAAAAVRVLWIGLLLQL
jgi:hypothetical protein